MKSTFKKLPGSKIALEVELTKEEFLPYYKEAYDKALAGVRIKGFRPGMAPKEIAEHAVDKEEVFNEAAKSAVRWSLDEITKDKEWTLIDTPHIEIEDSHDLGIKYKAELTLFPEIKLGNYKKIAHQVMGEKKAVPVEEKEIDQTLEWIRNSRKESLPAGRQGEKVPELNDDFAKSVGKFQNMEELKKSINEGLQAEKETKEVDRLRLKMLDEIIKSSEIDLPEGMIKKTYANMHAQLGPMLKASGKSEDEIKKDLEDRARNNVVSNLVIYKIAQAEHLEPTPEEIEEKQGSVEDESKYDYIYGMIQNQKVFAFLEKQ